MKKRLVFAMTLVIAVLLTACGSSGSGGEDSSHPYGWKAKGNGSIQVTIQNAPEEGYSWQYDGTDTGVIAIERTDNGNGRKAVFSLTGQAEDSSGLVSFVCQRDSAPSDINFRLDMMLETSEKGKLEVVSAEYTEFPAVGSAGEDGKASCMWYTSQEDGFVVYLDNAGGNYDWESMSYDSAVLSVSEPTYGDSGLTYVLTGVSAGETELLLYDLSQRYGFRLTVSVSEDLAVSVTGSEAGALTIDTKQIPGMTDAETLVGSLNIPEGTSVVRCVVRSMSDDDTRQYADITLQANDISWSWSVTKSYSVQELIALFYTDNDNMVQIRTTVGASAASLCSVDSVYSLFWSDAQGRTFMLNANFDGVTQDALLNMAAKLNG